MNVYRKFDDIIYKRLLMICKDIMTISDIKYAYI